MTDYCYYYARALRIETTGPPRIDKFLRGNPKLLGIQDDAWKTYGKYRLQSRPLTGGLSGTGDVYHPAKIVFKQKKRLPSPNLRRQDKEEKRIPLGESPAGSLPATVREVRFLETTMPSLPYICDFVDEISKADSYF